MFEIEITGSRDEISDLKQQLRVFGDVDLNEYQQKSASGITDVFGLIGSVPSSIFGKVMDVLLRIVKERTLGIEVNGVKLVVKDVKELSDVLELLASRNLLPTDFKSAGN